MKVEGGGGVRYKERDREISSREFQERENVVGG